MTKQEVDNGLGPRINISSLPDISKAEMDFHDTAFFQNSPSSTRLPTPAEIVEQFPHLNGGGRGVAKFEHLNLIVKGRKFSLSSLRGGPNTVGNQKGISGQRSPSS